MAGPNSTNRQRNFSSSLFLPHGFAQKVIYIKIKPAITGSAGARARTEQGARTESVGHFQE